MKAHERRLAALERTEGRGFLVAYPDDEPPRFVWNGAPVSAEEFERLRPRVAHTILVRYDDDA